VDEIVTRQNTFWNTSFVCWGLVLVHFVRLGICKFYTHNELLKCNYSHKAKGKSVPSHAKHAQRRGTGIALPMLDPSARRWWVINATSQLLYPMKETCYALHKSLGGRWGLFGWVQKVPPPLGFELQT
jgi:hypothetical protein